MRGVRKYVGGKLNSPVTELLKKGSMSVSSPTQGWRPDPSDMGCPQIFGGRTDFSSGGHGRVA
eukprot:7968058-Pyramimonas_sp.AAC.4